MHSCKYFKTKPTNMQETINHPSPEAIMKMGTGFWGSKVLLTAVQFQLFTRLAEKKSLPASQIKSILGLKCTDRHVYDFLDTLTTFGFLQREGLLETARYSNTGDTGFFLDKNKPSYIGGMLEMFNQRLYGFWGHLGEALLTGTPQNEAKNNQNIFEILYKDPEELRKFIHAMSGIQMGGFMALAQNFDFSKASSLVDIGGSAGLLSVQIAKHHPQMHCISWDLPPVAAVAEETIQKFQMQDRVKTGAGDFFKDEFPKADIVVMGNILHDWDEETKLMLIKKAYAALPAGGALIVIENIIDTDRNHNAFGMMMSLNMLIETGTGFDFSFEDFNKWAAAAGFATTRLLHLAGPSSAAIAIK
jgi:precorrin-6B methylase 2